MNSKNLFKPDIYDWRSWSLIFQSVKDFKPLITMINKINSIPESEINKTCPGTNAVFSSEKFLYKIYAPEESGLDSFSGYETELFGLNRSNDLNISVPKIIAHGTIKDKYDFHYLVMNYINYPSFSDCFSKMSKDKKQIIGKKLKEITQKMNTDCIRFNNINYLNTDETYDRWANYPDSFKIERKEFINSHNFSNSVYVHGDLNGDNILIDNNSGIHIIDFADSLKAPNVYEEALIASELFLFDKTLIKSYFGNISTFDLTELIIHGLLIHDFGGDIIKLRIGNGNENSFENLNSLKHSTYKKLNG